MHGIQTLGAADRESMMSFVSRPAPPSMATLSDVDARRPNWRARAWRPPLDPPAARKAAGLSFAHHLAETSPPRRSSPMR